MPTDAIGVWHGACYLMGRNYVCGPKLIARVQRRQATGKERNYVSSPVVYEYTSTGIHIEIREQTNDVPLVWFASHRHRAGRNAGLHSRNGA